jgi:hypothetical protein
MPLGLDPPVDISPVATGVWASVDVTSHVHPHEGNTSGVIIFAVNTDPINPREFGIRKNGSTDSVKANLWIENAGYHYIGVDSGNVVEIYIEHATVQVYLIGLYTQNEAVFLTNPVDKSILVPSVWTTISVADITGSDTPILAFLRISNPGAQAPMAIRTVGSTTTDTAWLAHHQGIVVKVDSSQEFELFLTDVSFAVDLLGYQKQNATMQIDKVDYSTATVDAWEPVLYSDSHVPDGSNGVYFHLTNNSTAFQRKGAHRALGSGFDTWYKLDKQVWGWSLIDGSGRGEQKINNTEMNLYLLGYTEESPTSLKLPYSGRSIHGGASQFNGGLL